MNLSTATLWLLASTIGFDRVASDQASAPHLRGSGGMDLHEDENTTDGKEQSPPSMRPANDLCPHTLFFLSNKQGPFVFVNGTEAQQHRHLSYPTIVRDEWAVRFIMGKIFRFNTISKLSDLCSSNGEDITTQYTGVKCHPTSNEILWIEARTLGKDESRCKFIRSDKKGDMKWLNEYMGHCGVSPTEVPLPTHIDTKKFSWEHGLPVRSLVFCWTMVNCRGRHAHS